MLFGLANEHGWGASCWHCSSGIVAQQLLPAFGSGVCLPLPTCLPSSPPPLQGYGLTYVLMYMRLRLGLHKHAKEGLLCLLESCTADEAAKVSAALPAALPVAFPAALPAPRLSLPAGRADLLLCIHLPAGGLQCGVALGAGH